MSVDEDSLVFGDAVKGQNPCMLVQVDADPFGLWCTQQFFLVIVPKGKSAPRPVQTPRQLIVAQTALVIITLAFYLFVGNSDGDLHDGSEKNKFSEGHKCKSRLLITLAKALRNLKFMTSFHTHMVATNHSQGDQILKPG